MKSRRGSRRSASRRQRSNAATDANVHGNARRVERVDRLFIDQHVLATSLAAPAPRCPPAACGCGRGTAHRRLRPNACNQRLAQEHLARGRGVDGAERHATPRNQREPVQRDTLRADHFAARRIPTRIEVRPIDPVAGDFLDPLGIDARARNARTGASSPSNSAASTHFGGSLAMPEPDAGQTGCRGRRGIVHRRQPPGRPWCRCSRAALPAKRDESRRIARHRSRQATTRYPSCPAPSSQLGNLLAELPVQVAPFAQRK